MQACADDMENGLINAARVRCVVFDEAHRATRGRPYWWLARAIGSSTKCRLVALSAALANNAGALQELVRALTIEAIECRTRNSPDVECYVPLFVLCRLAAPLSLYKSVLEQVRVGRRLAIQRSPLAGDRAYGDGSVRARRAEQECLGVDGEADHSGGANVQDGCAQNLSGARRVPHLSADPALQRELVSADLMLLASLYHMLETLEVYGARSLYAYMRGLSQDGRYMWKKVLGTVTLDELYKMLEEVYRRDMRRILIDEEETCQYAVSHGSLPVRCALHIALCEERFFCRRRRRPKSAKSCWRSRTRKWSICCALSKDTSEVRWPICCTSLRFKVHAR